MRRSFPSRCCFFLLSFLLCRVDAWAPLTVDVNTHDHMLSPSVCEEYEQMPVLGVVQATIDMRLRNWNTTFQIPRHYWLMRCSDATLVNTDGGLNVVKTSLTAGRSGINTARRKHAFIGIDLGMGGSFQHEVINSAGSVGLAWHFIMSRADVDVIVYPMLYTLLKPSLGMQRLRIFNGAPLAYNTLYVASPLWRGEDGTTSDKQPTWDTYSPSGTVNFMAEFFASLGVPQVPTEQRKLFLYLDRAPSFQRQLVPMFCRSDCDCTPLPRGEYVAHLRDQVEARGYEFRIFTHQSIALDQRLFRSARYVAGSHGGAFANIIWLQPGSTVIEINAEGRLCFAGVSIGANVYYFRYTPLRWIDYFSEMRIDALHFAQYVGAVLRGAVPRTDRAPCTQVAAEAESV